ncbi:MAG: hypothetical protein KatS3mg065_0795 [Chloroflexota bacterium]|nr:MAG: hypothetical protein KatS3mg065_0795 [Chloroflexota bacterium]
MPAAAWLVRDRFTASRASPELTTERSTATLVALELDPEAVRAQVEALRPDIAELLSVFDLGSAASAGAPAKSQPDQRPGER